MKIRKETKQKEKEKKKKYTCKTKKNSLWLICIFDRLKLRYQIGIYPKISTHLILFVCENICSS